MKRVKIMLTAIAVLAVVGGALAFKAKTFGSQIYCTTTAGLVCSVPSALGFTVVKPIGQVSVDFTYCTNVGGKNLPCPQVSIYTKP